MNGSFPSLNRVLVRNVPIARPETTVAEVEERLRAPHNNFNTINYIYVLSPEQHLLGVVSIRELFQLEHDEVLGDHMRKEIITANEDTKPEALAQLALRHGLKAVPILRAGVFLGVIAYDTILNILNHEHTRDVLQFAGVSTKHDESISEVLHLPSPLSHVRLRLPWLVVGLGGGLVAALVIDHFEATLAHELILAAFIPAIVYMADAVGSQTQMLFVRALSTNQELSLKKQLLREATVNFLLGLILGSLVFLVTMLWFSSWQISAILGVSIFLTVWLTVVVAILLPWFFHSRGYDPAIASGPLATVTNDVLSIIVYLCVASFFLGF